MSARDRKVIREKADSSVNNPKMIDLAEKKQRTTTAQSTDKKIKAIRKFMAESIEKPHFSSFDLFQNILFTVQLSKGDKLAKVVAEFEGFDPRYDLTSEELHQYAIEALATVMPLELFKEYTKILTQKLVKKANRLYPDWEKEFDKLCLQAEKLKMHEGTIQN